MVYRNNLGQPSYFLQRFLATFWILLFILAAASCDSDSVTNNDSIPDVERITGFYEAVKFIEPGEHDGGVDILANGGVLTARLTSDFEVEGRLVIPGNIGSNFAPTDTNYTGLFDLDRDTVRFKDTNTLLDYYPSYPLMFIVTGTRLETVDWEESGRWAIKIVMEKQ